MRALIESLPYVAVGVPFTAIGVLKIYGRWKGIVGGGGKPMSCRLMGSCPTWTRHVNIIMTWLFFVIGIVMLGLATITILGETAQPNARATILTGHASC